MMRRIVPIFLAFMLSATLAAQEVPRTAFDGKPDFSGVWENVGPAGPPEQVTLNDVPYATAGNIGAGFRIGLPLQPAGALLKQSRRHRSGVAPDVRCQPIATHHLNAFPFPRQIVHAPGLIAIVYGDREGRQIFTDGRPAPTRGTQRFSYGYSRGAWSGDTLLVLTTHYRDGGWLDLAGSPLTEAGRTVERFRLVSEDTIEIEQMVDDPKAYQRAFTTRLTWTRTASPMAPPCR